MRASPVVPGFHPSKRMMALLALLAAFAAIAPPAYRSSAAPSVRIYPCPPLNVLQNGAAGTARPMALTTSYACALTPKVTVNWAYRTGHHYLIEIHGQFFVHGPKQFISYSWDLTKKDSRGNYSTPVAHGLAACGRPVTSCNWGTYPIKDIGMGDYQIRVVVKFDEYPYRRYARSVHFNIPNNVFPWN